MTELKEKNKREFIGLIQAQLDSYKSTAEVNAKLIAELRAKLEVAEAEKSRIDREKSEAITDLEAASGKLSAELSEARQKSEALEAKVKSLE